jgi:hypothetical protein
MVIEHSYPVAPAALLATLTDPQYQAARLEKFGGVGDAQITRNGSQVEVRGTRQLPKDKLPAAAAPFVGDGQLVQVDTWESDAADGAPVTGTWKAEVGTAPVDLGGTYTITAADDGSTYSVAATVKVNVPFFGRQLEPQIESYLNSLVTAEQEFLAEWVARQG